MFVMIGIFVVIFMSWKTTPYLKEVEFVPSWLSRWGDLPQNNQIRTAVPFMGLGFLCGIYLRFSKRTFFSYWAMAWLGLIMIVCIAELGQYYIPSRQLDFMDVFWGMVGSGFGLGLAFFVMQALLFFKSHYRERKKRN